MAQRMKADGVAPPDGQPTADEIRKFDRQRADKRVSNDDKVSPTGADARIARRKDGTTHLAYKAEHVVDLDSNLIVAAEIDRAHQADVATLEDSVHAARTRQASTGSEVVIEEVVADKGYHSGETLDTMATETPYVTFIPKPRRKKKKPPRRPGSGSGGDASSAQDEAERANRQRMNTDRGRSLQRRRSEQVERTFGDALSLLQLAYLWFWGTLGSIFARFTGLERKDRFPDDGAATMLART